MTRAVKAVIIAGVMVAAVGSAIAWNFLGDRSMARFREEGIIRIGYAVEAPYAFVGPSGEVTGESPEVAKRIVARLGIPPIEWRQVEFGSLISGLKGQLFDVIAAGMFITPERARDVSFSEPTFHVLQGLLVKKGNPLRLHSYQQALTLTNCKLAVVSEAIEETLLRRMGMPESQLVPVPDALTGCVAVESGLADGLALSTPTIKWMALRERLGKAEMAQPFEQPELAREERLGFGAFAFRKKDVRLLSAWNAELKTFIGSPEHLKLVAQFGFTEAELPGAATTREVLATP